MSIRVLAHSPLEYFLGLSLLAYFAPGVFLGLGVLALYWIVSSLYILSCFKCFLTYILNQDVSL